MSDTTLTILQLVGYGAAGATIFLLVGMVLGLALGWRMGAQR